MKTYFCPEEPFLSLLVGLSFGALAEITDEAMGSLSEYRAAGKSTVLREVLHEHNLGFSVLSIRTFYCLAKLYFNSMACWH